MLRRRGSRGDIVDALRRAARLGPRGSSRALGARKQEARLEARGPNKKMRKSHDHEQSFGRHLRVGEAIRHALVEIFADGHFRDPELRDVSITVTEARATPDLRHVTVFIMPLGGRARDEIVAALNREAHWLRGEVTRAVRLKFAPQLRFAADETFDTADRVTALLSDPRVAQDLGNPPPRKPAPRRPRSARPRRG